MLADGSELCVVWLRILDGERSLLKLLLLWLLFGGHGVVCFHHVRLDGQGG